jgi:hypothetical protein
MRHQAERWHGLGQIRRVFAIPGEHIHLPEFIHPDMRCLAAELTGSECTHRWV